MMPLGRGRNLCICCERQRGSHRQPQHDSQLSPVHASRPSLTKNHTIANEPTPSIHHAPKSHADMIPLGTVQMRLDMLAGEFHDPRRGAVKNFACVRRRRAAHHQALVAGGQVRRRVRRRLADLCRHGIQIASRRYCPLKAKAVGRQPGNFALPLLRL